MGKGGRCPETRAGRYARCEAPKPSWGSSDCGGHWRAGCSERRTPSSGRGGWKSAHGATRQPPTLPRPLLRSMEQAHGSALAHHVHRPAGLGSPVLINETWYKRVRWVWSNTSDPAEWDRKIAALIASGQASADDEFLKFGWLKDRCGGADEAHEHLNPAPSCAPGCAHGGIGTVRG